MKNLGLVMILVSGWGIVGCSSVSDIEGGGGESAASVSQATTASDLENDQWRVLNCARNSLTSLCTACKTALNPSANLFIQKLHSNCGAGEYVKRIDKGSTCNAPSGKCDDIVLTDSALGNAAKTQAATDVGPTKPIQNTSYNAAAHENHVYVDPAEYRSWTSSPQNGANGDTSTTVGLNGATVTQVTRVYRTPGGGCTEGGVGVLIVSGDDLLANTSPTFKTGAICPKDTLVWGCADSTC